MASPSGAQRTMDSREKQEVVDCCAQGPSGHANQGRIGNEIQQTVESLSGSVLARASD